MKKSPWFCKLWFFVIIGMILGILFGIFEPVYAKQSKPIVDNFIHVIKILVCPIVFFTVVSGIIGMGSLKQLGSIGIKAFIYFEVVSSFALLIGLGSGHLFHPGSGMNLSVSQINPDLVAKYTSSSHEATSFTQILLSAIPSNPISPFLTGNTLQVLFMAIVCGFILFYAFR